MLRFYLVPVETVGAARGPLYFRWRFNPSGIDCRWNFMDYGFVPYGLVCAHDITQTDRDQLVLNPDVYEFPEILDAPVADVNVDVFFESINIPADWLTPSTTYRELLRNTAGMFQFNQRFAGISGGASLFDSADLNTRVRQLSPQFQEWFLLTVASFGFDPAQINDNNQLRLLLRQAAGFWETSEFVFGDVII